MRHILLISLLVLSGCAAHLSKEDRDLLLSIKANQDSLMQVVRLGRELAAAKKIATPEGEVPIPPLDLTGSPVLGDSAGKKTLVVFTDFQCPYCVKAHKTILNNARLRRAGIRAIIKNFPLEMMHPMARQAALGGILAHRKGHFGAYADSVTNFDGVLSGAGIASALVSALGPGDWLDSCESPEIIAQLNDDIQQAKKARVQGTPTFILDGKRISQGELLEAMRQP